MDNQRGFMKTVTVQIGNSDNKLSQEKWSAFTHDVRRIVESFSQAMHFSGGSSVFDPWQNTCFVFLCDKDDLRYLREALTVVRKRYSQDSVAVTVGDTEFI